MGAFPQSGMPPVIMGSDYFFTALDTCSAALLVSLEALSRAEAISSFRLPAMRPLFLMPVGSSAGIPTKLEGARTIRISRELCNQQSAGHAQAALLKLSSNHTCHVEGAA